MSPATPKRFKVAFSFAGEKRDFVAQVADILAAQFGTDCILYDKYHEAEFARFDLGIRLPMLYGEQSELIVPVLCPDYDQKRWTGWEWVHIYSLLTNKDGQRVMLSRFELATVAGLSEAAGFIELDHKTPREFADLILQRLAQLSSANHPSSGSVASATANPSSSIPPARLRGAADKRLQAVDQRFYGRDAIVAQVLDFLRGDANTLTVAAAKEVSGVGGIGKTEVCKAALKAWLTETPHAAAWYLSLPDNASLADLLDIAQRGLGLPSQVDTMDKLMAQLPPGLYYLDNLEGVLSQPEGIKALQAWAGQPDVRLLVSSRLSVPAVFGKTIEVDRLPDDAALRLFRETWAGPASQLPQDTELAPFVLGELGGHPLSIVLCARLGDWCSYAELLRRWRQHGARAADDSEHPTPRLGSLDTSLTLTAQALHQHNPHTLLLWAACALFHGGVPQDTLEELESTSGWTEARRWLVRHHVLTRNAEGRWAMLPPLARYALDAAQAGRAGFDWVAMRQPLQAMFAVRVEQVQTVRSDEPALVARAWLQQHFAALARLMQAEMQAVQADETWLQTMAQGLGNEYQFNAIVASPLLALLSTRYPAQAAFLLRQGDLESRLGEVDKARACYQEARGLFEKESAGLGLANTLRSLGDLESRLGEVDKARACYQEARGLYEKESAGLGLANTLMSIGDLQRRTQEWSAALATYLGALDLYQQEQEPAGWAYTLADIARCQQALGHPVERDDALRQAVSMVQQSNTPYVVAYVRDALLEITGSEAQAQAWLAAHFDN
ncbi:tetratricopeptide repeat protein [Rivihabitans pingtungensis]|uniref:tetratricopeptide repeat protein n=1 Tax=Rivihabitans pingtungensis TaxID=1054498 RepID=UPI0023533072|nr:tetratricopeptide repeat protein [Rivihabitans pingtungensis]MCK6435599.1 tetratricopeptide repeat protein [Rivihabitans pingtungensis]